MIKKPMTNVPNTDNTIVEKLIGFVGDPVHARKRRQGFIALLLLTVVADLLVTREHGAFPWDVFSWDFFLWQELPGGNALFGLLSCLLIIVVAKFLGHRCGLMQREDYYDD
jgi:hypothetical protein